MVNFTHLAFGLMSAWPPFPARRCHTEGVTKNIYIFIIYITKIEKQTSWAWLFDFGFGSGGERTLIILIFIIYYKVNHYYHSFFSSGILNGY